MDKYVYQITSVYTDPEGKAQTLVETGLVPRYQKELHRDIWEECEDLDYANQIMKQVKQLKVNEDMTTVLRHELQPPSDYYITLVRVS